MKDLKNLGGLTDVTVKLSQRALFIIMSALEDGPYKLARIPIAELEAQIFPMLDEVEALPKDPPAKTN